MRTIRRSDLAECDHRAPTTPPSSQSCWECQRQTARAHRRNSRCQRWRRSRSASCHQSWPPGPRGCARRRKSRAAPGPAPRATGQRNPPGIPTGISLHGRAEGSGPGEHLRLTFWRCGATAPPSTEQVYGCELRAWQHAHKDDVLKGQNARVLMYMHVFNAFVVAVAMGVRSTFTTRSRVVSPSQLSPPIVDIAVGGNLKMVVDPTASFIASSAGRISSQCGRRKWATRSSWTDDRGLCGDALLAGQRTPTQTDR